MLAEAIVAFRSQLRPGVFSLSIGRTVLCTYTARFIFQGALGKGLKIDSGQDALLESLSASTVKHLVWLRPAGLTERICRA